MDAELMHPVIKVFYWVDDLKSVLHLRSQRIHLCRSLQKNIELVCEDRAFPLPMRIRGAQHNSHIVAI